MALHARKSARLRRAARTAQRARQHEAIAWQPTAVRQVRLQLKQAAREPPPAAPASCAGLRLGVRHHAPQLHDHLLRGRQLLPQRVQAHLRAGQAPC